jgi:hypothetical protein
MRWILAAILLAALCCGARAEAFIFGGDDRATATVVINIAEAVGDTTPRYSMLWRRLDDEGRFTEYGDETVIEVESNSANSVLVRGVPGEFLTIHVRPGAYALDSVRGLLREDGVNYVASGVIVGPERPAFEVREGETIYLGIWQMSLNQGQAEATLWRLAETDLRAFLGHGRNRVRNVAIREARVREVACAPHPISWRTNREIC